MGNGLSLGTQVNIDCDAVPAAGKDTIDTALTLKRGLRTLKPAGTPGRPNGRTRRACKPFF